MERFFDKDSTKCSMSPWDWCGLDKDCKRDCWKPTPCKIPEMARRLAEYQDACATSDTECKSPEELAQDLELLKAYKSTGYEPYHIRCAQQIEKDYERLRNDYNTIAEMVASYQNTGLTPEQITQMQTILSENIGIEEYYTVRVKLDQANMELNRYRKAEADGEFVRVVRCNGCALGRPYHDGAIKCLQADEVFGRDHYCAFGERREQE